MRCRRKKGSSALCVIACILIAGGTVWLCFLSYKFLFIAVALLLVIVGIILIKRC